MAHRKMEMCLHCCGVQLKPNLSDYTHPAFPQLLAPEKVQIQNRNYKCPMNPSLNSLNDAFRAMLQACFINSPN